MNLAIANTSGRSACPAAVERSERDGLDSTARSRGPEGRASRARDGGNAATVGEKAHSSAQSTQLRRNAW